jgi:hypothetical protein
LEDALIKQLGGRYLRAQDANHGVLLVVHQDARPRGWRHAKGHMLTFAQVIAHLRGIADTTAANAPDAPQARIAVLNVSDIRTKPRVKKSIPTHRRRRKGEAKKAPTAKRKPKPNPKEIKRPKKPK